MRTFRCYAPILVVFALVLLAVWFSLHQSLRASSPDVVISQVYGGGGNVGATYTHDFVELFNLGTAPVALGGYSIQYAGAAGSSWDVTALSSYTLQPGEYYLIKMAAGAGGTVALPTPDQTGTTAIGQAGFKVALVNGTTALSGTAPSGLNIVDFLGAGVLASHYEGTAAPAPSNTTSVIRLSSCVDTDFNGSDFITAFPNPRNSQTADAPCYSIAPSIYSIVPGDSTANVALDSDIVVTFDQDVTVSGEWFTLVCGDAIDRSISGGTIVTNGPVAFTLNPTTDFTPSDTCTLTIIATQVASNEPVPQLMSSDNAVSFSMQSGPANTPTNTPTNTLVDTPTETPTGSPTDSSTATATGVSQGTPTNIPTATPVNVPAASTPTNTPTATPTNTPRPIPTDDSPGANDPTPTLMAPAPVPNGVAATISLNRTSAYGGQQVVVSGQAPSGYAEIRILIMSGAQTLTGGVVPIQNGAYSWTYQLGSPLSPQSQRLCAVVVGAVNAQLQCADLTIVGAPTGSVVGTLPGASTSASVALLNNYGATAYRTNVGSNGTFSFASVAPGTYQVAPYGTFDKPLKQGVVNVVAGVQVVANSAALNCNATNQLVDSGYLEVNPAYISPRQRIERESALLEGYLPKSVGAVGTYIQGVTGTNLTFTAQPQSTAPPQSVRFRFYATNGALVETLTDSAAPWSVVFDVGKLPASNGNQHPSVIAVPVVNGREECTAAIRQIRIIPNFLKLSTVRGNPISWNAAKQHYDVRVLVPNIPGVLPPPTFELPPQSVPALPFFGRFENGADAGLAAIGEIYLNGEIRLRQVNAFLWAKLLNTDLIGPSEEVLFYQTITANVNDLGNSLWESIRDQRMNMPTWVNDYWPPIYVKTPFLSVPVMSFFGLIDVTVHGEAGYGVAFHVDGYLKPLKPEVGMTFEPKASAHAELGAGLRVLQGLVEGGAAARIEGEIKAPIHVG